MSHFLLIYEKSTGSLRRISEYDSSPDALKARYEAEDHFRGNPDVEVVALSAASREALEKTHSRYFKTLKQLAGQIS